MTINVMLVQYSSRNNVNCQLKRNLSVKKTTTTLSKILLMKEQIATTQQSRNEWQKYLESELSDTQRNPEVLRQTPFETPFYDPKKHEQNINTILNPNQLEINQKKSETIVHQNSRPEHAVVDSSNAHIENSNFGVYATHIKFENEEDIKGDIPEKNMSALWRDVYNLISKEQVFIINPFHTEDSTIRRNVTEAMSWVGPENVYPISTGASPKSEEQAELTGVKVKKQEDILKEWNIDSTLLDENTNIQNDKLKGKGITMLAGVLSITKTLIENGTIEEVDDTLKLKDENNDPIIMFHDTDITNPTEYSSIPLTLLPFTKENKEKSEVIMSLTARTGEGRNNEPITNESNLLANDDNEMVARYGMELQPMVWPLTGERAIRISRLLKMPFANGMGIETTMNAYAAGVNASEYRGHIAHVVNTFPKTENSPSLPEREWGVIFPCQDMQRTIGKTIEQTQKLPNEFNLKDIKNYNEKSGGKKKRLVVPPNRPGANAPKTFETNYIVPSIAMLYESDIIIIPTPKNNEN